MTKLLSVRAADAAREILSKVASAVRDDLESLSNITGFVDAAERNLEDPYESAEILCREIVDTLQLAPDPVHHATSTW